MILALLLLAFQSPKATPLPQNGDVAMTALCNVTPEPAGKDATGIMQPTGYRILNCLPAEADTQATPQMGGASAKIPATSAPSPSSPLPPICPSGSMASSEHPGACIFANGQCSPVALCGSSAIFPAAPAPLPQTATITISEPPQQAFIATNSARLSGIAYYSAMVCSQGPALDIYGGQVTQAAEKAGINVIPQSMYASILGAAQSKGAASRWLTITKWTMVSVTIAAAGATAYKAGQKSPNAQTFAEITAGTASVSGGIQLFQSPLQSQVNAMQAMANAVNVNLINPATKYPVPAGGCGSSMLFLGTARGHFEPVKVGI